jgi:hypothetical protein
MAKEARRKACVLESQVGKEISNQHTPVYGNPVFSPRAIQNLKNAEDETTRLRPNDAHVVANPS